jgi:hypothetical protein
MRRVNVQGHTLKTLILLTVCLAAPPAAAQWITHPTPGIPRAADGKPNMEAPAPWTADGKPDLTGTWRLEPAPNVDVNKLVRDAGIQAWARERQVKYQHELGRDDPGVSCLPFGNRATLTYGFGGKFIQTQNLIVVLFEDLSYRQIFLDGRELPRDPSPSWMGYSVGRWDGDTLVVTSHGFKDRAPLDFDGHPHTEALRITERFRRRNFGHMDVQVTLEDPKTLERPVTLPMAAQFIADTELLEYVCQENEKSRQRMIGTLDDDKKLAVQVPAATLAGYTGDYRIETLDGRPRILRVYVTDGVLLMDVERGPSQMKTVPVSQTKFMAQGVAVEFFPRPDGSVSDVVVSIVEGDLKGLRVK